ncbi:hypothetical protein ACFORL_12300 [Legionella dresdenensis]|uniref:Carboxylate-amine ligase YbdK n=1 Tax=Legionella dresdenensis TaxID=450200 RepID=A0ABV8CHQ9_9GAMM
MLYSRQTKITQQDYEEFDKRLQAETALLEQWFIDKIFTERELEAGSEIELFLLDEHYDPFPHNLEFIKQVNEPFLIPEVGAAHLEINSCHIPLSGDFLSKLHHSILKCWQKMCDVAHQNNHHLALIGSLPTATDKMHHPSFMTDKSRYHFLNSSIYQQQGGKGMLLNIDGYEPLVLNPHSLAINGIISALQLHIQIGLSQSVLYYNIAQAIAGPMMALACNSPFILGHHLWSDSRIPLFDHTMTLQRFDRADGFKCCIFGTSYLKDSFFELFDQNYQFFPRLIPEVSRESPIEDMFHVRRQNGVVYRWNRPVIDFNSNHQPHLRIEHRGPATGPTVVDMIANAAFFYGLINYFAIQRTPIDYLLPFHLARKNFFNAARHGLDANFGWFLGRETSACALLHELIPLAHKGLQALGTHSDEARFYLNIIERRVKNRMNGSNWQLHYINKHGKDFHGLMARYLQNQYREIPVSDWPL